MLRGDFGMSFERNQPVAELIRARLPITISISLATLFAYALAIPIGIFSAFPRSGNIRLGITSLR